ncbi:MAG: hypothetical protein L7S64_07345 [Longimicrobiales bacterium]|nr:hypothetical protein [Longimicrobiales bacterium]
MHPDLPTSLDPGMARIGCAILSLSMLIGAVLIWSIGMAIWKVLFDG